MKTITQCILGLGLAVLTASSVAQSTNVMTIVVPFAPGAGSDSIARYVGLKLAAAVSKQSAVIDNKPGAGGQIAIRAFIRTAPDGSNLFVTPSGPITVTPHLQKLSYDPLKDLTPIAMLANVPTAIAVGGNSPYNTLAQLLAARKQASTPLQYSVSALGTHMHLAGELLSSLTGSTFQPIPYKGASSAATALASGEVPMGISSLTGLLPLAKAGKIKILAVTDGRRTSAAPDIPTVAEAGVPGYKAEAWIGLFGPAEMDRKVLATLQTEVERITKTPEFARFLQTTGLEFPTVKPRDFASFLAADSGQWEKVIRKAGIRIEN